MDSLGLLLEHLNIRLSHIALERIMIGIPILSSKDGGHISETYPTTDIRKADHHWHQENSPSIKVVSDYIWST